MTTGTATSTSSTNGKWVWRPRWCCASGPSPKFTLITVALLHVLLLLTTVVEDVQALGFFELQMLEIENYRGQLATGECCGSGGSSSVVAPQQPSPSSTAKPSVPLQCVGAPQCNTLFQLCLREYQNQAAVSATAAVAANGRMNGGDDDSMVSMVAFNHQQHYAYMHHCSFGNVTTPVLGGNSFTMGGDATASSDSTAPLDSNNRGTAVGNLALPFSFSWTRSFTFILQAMDYNNYTGDLSVIEEATYSGILLPGNEWKGLSHLGRTARMAYRVRVRCDRNYYGQTCTKLCKPRDDRFGHYTCGDTDGRKECIPGWQGETCDKAVCKTGCHPVHGKCDYPGGCECRKGWQGELCDQCMTYPGCKHGYCNGTSWQCICDINWGGILCDQDLNYCGTHEPCLNGGTCKSTAPDRYTCTCPEGFGGNNCDVVLNPCATDPCANGGKCRTVDAVGGANGASAGGSSYPGSAAQPPMLVPKQFHCDCQPGWTGSTCNSEIDECATQPPRCLNGGTCVDLVADWRCVCPDERWRGRRCEIDVDECERQHKERQPAVDHQCGPNAVSCRPIGATTATAECVCRRGWTTAMATVAMKENGTLTTAPLGCTVNVDDCAGPDVKCSNGGTCLDLIGGYACACLPGYTGRNCRTQIDPCGGDSESGIIGTSNPCKNGGECVPAKRWRNGGNGPTTIKQQQQQAYSCICPLGYSGENCEIDRDHCTPNPCRNGGQCLNTPDDYYCQCSGDGWSWHGKNCTVPADAAAAAAGAARTTATAPTTTTTTTTTTTMTTVSSTRSPPSTPQPHTTQAAAVRRPGIAGSETTARRPHQHRGDEDDNGKTVAVTIIEQVDDDGVAMCNGGHRHINYWTAVDGCNECKCAKSAVDDTAGDKPAAPPLVTCTNLWCGPASFDCLSGLMPCTGTNQICVPIVDDIDDEELLDEELDKREDAAAAVSSLLLWRQCLRPPCGGSGVETDRERDDVRLRYGYDDDDDAYVAVGPWPRHRRRGQCVTTVADDDDNTGPSTTVWPSAVGHCAPNGPWGDKHLPHRRRHGDACGRLRVILDPARLRRGTRVSAVCHSLRRLLARSWVREDDDGLDGNEARDRRNRVYVMCEVAEYHRDNNESISSRRRRRRRVTVRVSLAVVMDKQRRTSGTTAADDEDDEDAATVVENAVQTLYKRLNGGLVDSTAASTKKVPATSHRVRTGSNNGGDDYDDTAALAFLTAAVVDVIIGGGGTDNSGVLAEIPSSPSPANSAGPPTDDWQNYYYWTGGVACGALATVLAAMAFLLLRFRSNSRRKIGGDQVASGISESSVMGGGVDGSGGGVGDGLMLSLVRRQNEENLKRLVTGAGNRNSGTGSDYGGGCGRNNLMAGSSLSCSRVSIVHPLCNATAADEGCSPEMHRKSVDGGIGLGMDDDSKGGEKTNVAVPPVAAVRSVAVAVAVPRQQQQQRPSAVAAPQPMLLCKKTLNVDNDQQQRRQLQQQQHQILLLQQQQQQQQQHQQQHQQQQQQQQPQQQQQQQITAQQQYNRRNRGPPPHQSQQQQHYLQHHGQQQQQHYAQAPINNHINDDSDDETAPAPSLTVLV